MCDATVAWWVILTRHLTPRNVYWEGSTHVFTCGFLFKCSNHHFLMMFLILKTINIQSKRSRGPRPGAKPPGGRANECKVDLPDTCRHFQRGLLSWPCDPNLCEQLKGKKSITQHCTDVVTSTVYGKSSLTTAFEKVEMARTKLKAFSPPGQWSFSAAWLDISCDHQNLIFISSTKLICGINSDVCVL